MPDFLRLEDAVEFAENPEPRCPCVLLLDTSGSMQGEAINALNEGLKTFKEELNRDNLAKKRVEVAIITFNSDVNIVQDFITADQFDPPTLKAQGLTVMGSAIHKGLDMVASRKAQYSANGVAYYRPWVFLITDGAPTDSWYDAAQQVRLAEAKSRLLFFAVGVKGADMNTLKQIAVPERPPVMLDGTKFKEMFQWLSTSMKRVSSSQVGGSMIVLPAVGWGQVAT